MVLIAGVSRFHRTTDTQEETVMSHFFDKLTFFRRKPEIYAGGHGITTEEDRQWEKAYRGRWAYDKIVRSTHGANCTGSCSWKI